MKYIIISASLSPSSKSRILAKEAFELVNERTEDAVFLDLREIELPFCDADQCYRHPNVKKVSAMLREAKGILLASPIYNYDINSVAKNLLELTGRAGWTEKVVGFLCAAGGQGSYMSVMPFANSLMLDFRCVIIPRFVYTTGRAFEDGRIVSDEIRNRIDELVDTFVRFTEALSF